MRISKTIICGVTFAVLCECSFAESALPPNWRHGGKAKEIYRPRDNLAQNTEETKLSAHEKKASQSNWSLGVTAGVPELLRFDLRHRFNSQFNMMLSVGPAWPFDITVEMPSDVIRSDKSNTLAAAYTAFDAHFKAAWGPQIQAGAFWFPFAGSWQVFGGAGMRQFSLKGEAQSQVRVCTIAEAIKEPPCGNDELAIQTRNSLKVSTSAVVRSITGTVATGWLWQSGKNWEILLMGGLTKAIKSTYNVEVDAEIIDADGVPQELGQSLIDMKTKSEQDVKDKAVGELKKLQETTLPVLSLGLGYQF